MFARVRERLPLLIGLTILSVALVIGSFAIAKGIRDRNQNNVITVTGSAKQEITSDYAIWDFSVTSQSSSASDAAKALDGWTQETNSFLKAQGVQPDELTVQPIATNPVTQGANNRVVGFQLTRNYEVRSGRVSAIAGVAEASSQLLAKGIPLSAQPLQYVYTKLGDIRAGLLARAVRDAQQRAKVLTAATNGKVGSLRGVDVSPFQVTPPNSTQVSDYGVYDTSTLKKDVTAVVNVTFALN
jgi:hypothetical protein